MTPQTLHDYRMDRMEADLTRIADAITNLVGLTERVDMHDRWLRDVEARVRVLETHSTESKSSIGAWERFAWLVVAAVVAAAVKWMPVSASVAPPAALAIYRTPEEAKAVRPEASVE